MTMHVPEDGLHVHVMKRVSHAMHRLLPRVSLRSSVIIPQV